MKSDLRMRGPPQLPPGLESLPRYISQHGAAADILAHTLIDWSTNASCCSWRRQLQLKYFPDEQVQIKPIKMGDDGDFDVDAMLEAPYEKEVL